MICFPFPHRKSLKFVNKENNKCAFQIVKNNNNNNPTHYHTFKNICIREVSGKIPYQRLPRGHSQSKNNNKKLAQVQNSCRFRYAINKSSKIKFAFITYGRYFTVISILISISFRGLCLQRISLPPSHKI